MKLLCLLYAVALFAGATTLKAQTSNPPANDPAITALSVMGVVSEIKSDTRQVMVTTAAGSQVIVTLGDRTVYIQNLLNSTNLSQPIGNLSSPQFGESISTAGSFGFGPSGSAAAGNRRIQVQVRFGF